MARRYEDVVTRFYPETRAGGFSRVDGTIAFYERVNALIGPQSTVVDFGAGRGRLLDDDVTYRRDLQMLRNKAARVIGLDVDQAVMSNPALDEAHVIEPGAALPLGDHTVDVVVSDFTFEHIQDPVWAGRELSRILKPGGWICARTPNRWGLIGIPTRLIPNRFHNAVLSVVQPRKRRIDTFPTAYQLNSPAQLRRYFPVAQFDHYSYPHESEPAYVGASTLAWWLTRAVTRITPSRFGSMLFVFLRKR